MARTLPELGTQLVTDIEAAWAQSQPDWARRRLLVVRLIAQHELTVAQIMRAADVCRQTVFTYRDTVVVGGVAALLTRGESPGRPPTVQGAVAAEFVTRLEAGQFRQARDAQAWIKQRTHRELTVSWVRQFLHRVDGKLKGPRMEHAKQDQSKAAQLKAEFPAPEGGDRPMSGTGLVSFLCVTHPRCEKKFAALLAAQKLAHYLPLINSERRYGERVRRYAKPLFPGYVFARFGRELRSRVHQPDMLARLILIEDEPKFLRQLAEVRLIVASGLELSLHPLIKRGSNVRIVGGPLRGLAGVVDDPINPKGIVIAMDMLRKGVLVKMPLANLQPLP